MLARIVCFAGIIPYTALLSPPPHPRLRRSSPAPVGGGSSRDIPSKGASTGKASPDHASAGIIPHTVPWGISRGEGLGEGTPSPAKRTMLALPQGSRAGAGVLVARARAGRGRGEATLISRFAGISPCTALLSPTPPHRKGQ